jgi:F-type H+-transporting ATPase subunit b
VWLAIAFAFLYVIISRVALPRVRSLIDARQNTIEGDLAQAMQLKEESNAALSAYEGELASARARAQAIDAEAREKVNQAAVEARESLDANLATRLAEAESRIAASSSIAMSNLREIAIEAAGEIVLRLTGTAPESKSVEAAVDATLKK